MKSTFRLTVLFASGIAGAAFGESAVQFQNLSFEAGPTMPLVNDDPSGYVRFSIGKVMPGWSAYLDSSPLTLVGYNNYFLSSAGVSLFGPPPGSNPFPNSIMEGSFTAFLQSGHGLGLDEAEIYSASLGQMGLVPPAAASVQMKIVSYGPFSVFLGGQKVEMVSLERGPNYTLYGGDVSSFAGQVAELRITSDLFFSPTIGGFSQLSLDSIEFSPQVVPEPSTWVLLGLGGLGIAMFCRRTGPRRTED